MYFSIMNLTNKTDVHIEMIKSVLGICLVVFGGGGKYEIANIDTKFFQLHVQIEFIYWGKKQ